MSTKFIAAALAVATLAGSVVTTTGSAQARNGVGLGLGIVAGAVVAGAIANNAYAEPTYVVREHRHCRWVRNYDAYGYYVGKTRVCNY
ncbi:MAG: hypothetical protein JWN71_4243 [Xanthobacteraceae bacterium]|jgi:hypothetical protein|nr:hypothetical protein [Xanthobacteraceae bacterium]